jgi:enolase-phosphatase E1
MFSGWFDTAVGHKRDADSYRRIAAEYGGNAGDIVFLSDIVEELDAARDAGMRTVLLDRREDYPRARSGEATHGHERVESFADIALPPG